jgi:hypothetical protein
MVAKCAEQAPLERNAERVSVFAVCCCSVQYCALANVLWVAQGILLARWDSLFGMRSVVRPKHASVRCSHATAIAN